MSRPQVHPRDVVVSPVPGRTPDVTALAAAVAGARQRGLSVMIRLHVDVLDVDVLDGTWRADIRPESPALWFESYRATVLPLAEQAAAWSVERFVVGTELAGLMDQEDLWRRLIAEVREVYPGEILYSASWDEPPFVPFWDAVDRIGVNADYPVAVRPDPTRWSSGSPASPRRPHGDTSATSGIWTA